MKNLILILLLAPANFFGQNRITYPELVNRLTDLEYLANPPMDGEISGNFSSYDRNSKYDINTNSYSNWDANRDGTGYIRKINNDIVEISGVKGYPATDTYKVSINYFNGYKASGQLTISGPNALEKAQFTSELIWKRLKNAGISFDDYLTEYLGVSSCHGNKIKEYKSNSNEVVIRLSVRDIDKSKVIRFGKELAPVITSGPPGVTGFSGGRPRPQEIIAFWPCLINKKHINIEVVE